jgi:hypothetical protein
MQACSGEWIEYQARPFVNEQLIRIEVGLTDDDAREKMSISDSGHISISNAGQTIDKSSKDIRRYATMELDQWLLDGSVITNELLDIGYVSDGISAADRTISETITLTFSEYITSTLPGITILWDNALDGEFPTDFTVEAFQGLASVGKWTQYGNWRTSSVLSEFEGVTVDVPISSVTPAPSPQVGCRIYDNSEPPRNGVIDHIDDAAQTYKVRTTYVTGESECTFDLTGYNKIVITITKWCLPGRRARINNIMLGQGQIYTKDDITEGGFEHTMIIDTYGEELPKNSIKFSLSNEHEKRFNIMGTGGLTKYLMKRQPVTVQYGMVHDDTSLEWIDGGTYWLNEWGAAYGSGSAYFGARDKLLILNIPFNPDAPVGNMKLSVLMTQVIAAANLQPSEYDIIYPTVQISPTVSVNMGDIIVGYLKQSTSIADAFKLIAQAGCMSFWIDRAGHFYFQQIVEPGQDELDYFVTPSIMFQYPNVEKSADLREIRIKQYTYTSPTQATTSDYIDIITGLESDQSLQIDNPLVVSNNHLAAISAYLRANVLDAYKITPTYRHDPRLDGGDWLSLTLKEMQSFPVIARNITAKFTGAWKATCITGMTRPVALYMTDDIEFSADTYFLDLGVTSEHNPPEITFTVDAQSYYHDDLGTKHYVAGGIIDWTYAVTQISATGAIADSITLTPSAGGRTATITIKGNYKISENLYGYSTNSFVLTAKTPDGYSENQAMGIIRG